MGPIKAREPTARLRAERAHSCQVGSETDGLIMALSNIGRYDLCGLPQIETLIEGICRRSALFKASA